MKNHTFAVFSISLTVIFATLSFNVHAQNHGALFTDEATAKQIFYSGNMAEAAKHFKELLRVDSMHYEYNMMAGYAYLHSNVDKKQAITHYLRAIKNPKADLYIYYDLGNAYMLCYQFDEAIEYFQTFLKKGGKIQKGDLPAERCIEMCENAQVLINLRNNVTIEHLASEINSPYPDFNAYIDENESILYFTSKQTQNSGSTLDYDGFKMADIYCSEFIEGKWSKAKKLLPPINSTQTENIVGLTHNGETMLLYFNNDKGFDDIFTSHKEKKQFSRPEMLNLSVNSNYTEEAAMISPDGNWLFFSSNRPDGLGGLDIYYSKRLPNGEWSNAQNAGPNINTRYDDNYPYLAPDGSTFFFSSKGHNSMGGYDLFKSLWNAEEQFFAIPENLAFPINTPDDNRTISVSKSGRYAYIADYRGESCGDMDIYKVTFQDVAAPYSVFKGVISDIDSTELLQTISQYKAVIRDAGSKNIIGNYRPEPHDGRFTFILQPGLYLIDLYANETEVRRTRLTVADREPAEKCPIIELKKQP